MGSVSTNSPSNGSPTGTNSADSNVQASYAQAPSPGVQAAYSVQAASAGGLIPEPKEKLNANPDAVYELLGIKWNDRKKMQVRSSPSPVLHKFCMFRLDLGGEKQDREPLGPALAARIWECFLRFLEVGEEVAMRELISYGLGHLQVQEIRSFGGVVSWVASLLPDRNNPPFFRISCGSLLPACTLASFSVVFKLACALCNALTFTIGLDRLLTHSLDLHPSSLSETSA
ncbi:hypothetical protein BJ508DRAFT_36018 [Ascobolus immersus RN42]|uniref:Uncharacterized protein n=1 Tax=Ascobolus immersus RN42 TaxID=1160509 RepID=A0A3N4HQJ9_ASCIM|nr:hypothetical protein BJ508DRAFT_36018 [Ascobolus immersus RN42]